MCYPGPRTPVTQVSGPYTRQEREAKEGAGTPASAHFAQALRLPIPRTTTVSSSTVTVRDTAVPTRLSSLRIGLAATPRRPGESPTDRPVGTGYRPCDREGERAKRATHRSACDRKASEAAHQATREPGFAGRPVAPPRGDRRASAVGGIIPTGRQAKRSRTSSHTRARLRPATRGAPWGQERSDWGAKNLVLGSATGPAASRRASPCRCARA